MTLTDLGATFINQVLTFKCPNHLGLSGQHLVIIQGCDWQFLGNLPNLTVTPTIRLPCGAFSIDSGVITPQGRLDISYF